MGRLLHPEGGDILIIAGLLGMIGQEEREMGFRSVLRERYARCRVLDVLESFEQRDRVSDLVCAALSKNPRIRGIYNASTGASPVIQALRAQGREHDVVFITHELTEDRRQMVRSGLIDAIIDQNPPQEVRLAVECVARLLGRLDGKARTQITPTCVHMIENA